MSDKEGLAAPVASAPSRRVSQGPVMPIGGAVPLDDEGNLVGAGDVRAQARQTLHNLMRQHEAAGASGEDVLKTTVYVASTDRADLVACWEEVQLAPRCRGRTLLGAALLSYAGQLVEIEAIAVLP